MKIALTATGTDLSSDLDPRFGRAQRFLVVDTDTMDVEVVENTHNQNLARGAGIQAASTLAESGARTLITGNCGPKAFQVLQQAGIEVITGARGKMADVLEQYKNGQLQSAAAPNVQGHWAQGRGRA